MKRCPECGVVKSLDAFNLHRTRKDGRQSVCRVCGNVRSRRRYHKDPIAWRVTANKLLAVIRADVDLLKQEPCMDCHGRFPTCVMDFHHRDPSTKIKSVSTLVHRGGSREKVFAEIAKCDLLCANCHRIRTYGKVAEKLGARLQNGSQECESPPCL